MTHIWNGNGTHCICLHISSENSLQPACKPHSPRPHPPCASQRLPDAVLSFFRPRRGGGLLGALLTALAPAFVVAGAAYFLAPQASSAVHALLAVSVGNCALQVHGTFCNAS